MRDDRTEVESALDELAESVATQSSGWTRRYLADGRSRLLALTSGSDIVATVDMVVTSPSVSLRWPVEVAVRFGVGYRPATDLMPLVTLRPWLALADDGPAVPFELTGPTDVARVATQIAETIAGHGRALAESSTLDSLVAAVDDGWDADLAADVRPVVLAAAGRADAARALLEESAPSPSPRVARQLRRWLDAGGPPIPPAEQTLAQLPPPHRRPIPSFSTARRRSESRREANEAVRAVARGKTRDELIDLLAHEYAQRDLDAAPSVMAQLAEMIELERQPFGRVRSAMRAFSVIGGVGRDTIATVRGQRPPTPPWLLPPEPASYPVDVGSRYAPVTLDDGAAHWLAAVAADATHRAGPIVLVDLWLLPAGDELNVYLGEQRIGTLPPDCARAFAADVRAAQTLFDELPFVRGRLMPASGGRPALVEIGWPDHDG